MTPELIPCPLCGHFAYVTTDYAASVSCLIYGVRCANDGECEVEIIGFASAEAAIIRWNSRKMVYTHRNGETEAPTVPGKYWFDGSAILWTGEIKLRQALDAIGRDSRILVWEERSLEHLPVAQFSGQWFGPIVAPWEQGA